MSTSFPKEIYENRFFLENGFVRKLCPGSNEYFWTQDPERVYGGTQPGVQYTFIGKKVFDGAYTLRELRERAVNWYATQGHAPMQSYPVLASLWRDDLLFNSASICDFQPHVIERQLLPPANPVVVPQKCVRLNDLENIGRSGRHLSSFTMLGHHAFNFEGEPEIYWIDRTVELCHRFFTEELGANGEAITYVESVWAGGGNAGPCVEVIYEGIEIATLVFMCLKEVEAPGKYDIKGVHYDDMPTRVVDTGYGIERIVWASQGTPNIYEAVSPGFVKALQEKTGVELRGELIDAYFAKMSSEDIEDPLEYERVQARIASELGVTPKELATAVRPVETIFTICDFTRTLLLMLNDHVLPSNKDAGYMVRHLAKRIMTMISEEDLPVTAEEVMGLQYDFLVQDFPELEGKRDTVVDIMRVEQERHESTMQRGHGQLIKEIQQLQKKGRKTFPEEKIFFYYDTLGLPVPYIREVVEANSDLELEISRDFWDKFFKKNMDLGQKSSKPSLPSLSQDTRRLYYEDPYATDADAKIIHAQGQWLALDQTLFYPDGGGQPADHGVIRVGSESFVVEDARVHNGVVFHKINREVPQELVGEGAHLELDWARRYQLMKAHSTTHLLNATLKQVLGFHVRQMGAQKGVDATRFDISHYQTIGPDQIAEIEERVNEAIFAGAPISTEVMERGKAESKYGFFIYQGGFVPFDNLRIVTVEGIDTEACAGTHLRDIREASLFKLLGVSQIQNNVYRLRYSVAGGALSHFHDAEEVLGQIEAELGTARDVTAQKVKNLFKEAKEQAKRLGDYEEAILRLEAQNARQKAEGGPSLFFFKSAIPKDNAIKHLIRMARTDKNQAFFVVFKDGAILVRSKDVKVDLRDAQEKLAQRGEILRATPDMVIFGGEVEAGAAWDLGRSLFAH